MAQFGLRPLFVGEVTGGERSPVWPSRTPGPRFWWSNTALTPGARLRGVVFIRTSTTFDRKNSDHATQDAWLLCRSHDTTRVVLWITRHDWAVDLKWSQHVRLGKSPKKAFGKPSWLYEPVWIRRSHSNGPIRIVTAGSDSSMLSVGVRGDTSQSQSGVKHSNVFHQKKASVTFFFVLLLMWKRRPLLMELPLLKTLCVGGWRDGSAIFSMFKSKWSSCRARLETLHHQRVFIGLPMGTITCLKQLSVTP